MVKYQDEIVRNMKQRVRTPQFLNRVIKVYDFTTLFSRLMMYRRAKSSLVQPKKEGEEETTYNMYNSMFIRIKEKNKLNDRKMKTMCESMSSCLHYGWKRVNQLSIHDLNYWHTLWSVIFTFFR